MRSPFKFLDPFELADKDVFFGRDKEVDALYEMVYQTGLVLVYGYSGTGKTSLVQCGLAGRFDGPQWHPFFIRRGEDINASLRRPLFAALKEEPQPDVSLVELVEDLLDEYLSPVYLIFDQFEELFILGSHEEQEQFARDIQELLSHDLACKTIFILREEYLGELYQLEKAIPRLFDFKLRVEPMSKLRVQEVLRSSFAAFNISLEEPAEARLEEIIENVSMKKAGIQLPYLQVYLDQLYREDYARTYGDEERGRAGDGESGGGPPYTASHPLSPSPSHPLSPSPHPPLEFTRQEIQSFGTMAEVFPRFLEGQKANITRKLKDKYPAANIEEGTVQDVLDVFVTEEGTKRPIPFEQEGEALVLPERLLEKFPLPPAPLAGCLKALEQSRILRVREGSYELAHDSLAALIDEQRTDEQRQLNEVKNRIASAYREWERTEQQEYLTRKQLDSFEALLPKVQLEPHLKQFITDSYAYNEAQEEAERRRQQVELELTQAKLAAEERARKRQRLFLILVSFVLLLAVWQWWEAQRSKKKQAEDNLVVANEATEVATNAKKKAFDNLDLANQRKVEAIEAKRADSLKAIDLALALKEADAAKQQALANLDLANQREKELYIASEQTAKLLLKDARQLIRNLKYGEALEKLESIVGLKVLKDSVALGLLEVAYYYNETRKNKEARQIADRVGSLLSLQKAPETLETLIDEAAPGFLDTLKTRYYPQMVLVPAGRLAERNVSIDSFYIAATETTIWQFSIFCQETGRDIEDYSYSPTLGVSGPNPAVYVDWYDALEYANWLSSLQNKSAVYLIDTLNKDTLNFSEYDDKKWTITANWEAGGFRLPTKTEWEYAAREGSEQSRYDYSGSDNIDEVAWYAENSSIDGTRQTHPVKGKKPNKLGLYDMSGNAWEWCWDWHTEYDPGIIDNPKGPDRGRFRVLRGGSWSPTLLFPKISGGRGFNPDFRFEDFGFRLARAVSF